MKLDLTKWEPITFAELEVMPQNELDQLLSYCWMDGKGRCQTIGIWDVKMHRINNEIQYVHWSDGNGDPRINWRFFASDKIHKITDDGEWIYGLYKPKIL